MSFDIIVSEKKKQSVKMNFSDLPDVPRRKIFKYMKMLSIGNRYNASLVWQEMVDDIQRSIPPVEEFVKPFLHGNDVILNVDSLEDVETAGVLASTGHLGSLVMLNIRAEWGKRFFGTIYREETSFAATLVVNNTLSNRSWFSF